VTLASARAPLTVLVLAAGLGKRMRSARIKVLHEVAGRPMGAWVLEAARGLAPRRIATVVGHQADDVRAAFAALSDDFVDQGKPLGTGHAVRQAAPLLSANGAATILILNGDIPAVTTSGLRAFLAYHRKHRADLSVLTTEVDDATGYGRIVRGKGGAFERIVEHGDATRDERKIREINAGIYCGRAAALLPALKRLRPANAQGEYYLTDVVADLVSRKGKVVGFVHTPSAEVLGVNTRAELAAASRSLYARKAADLQEAGVTLLDPARTFIDPRAKIGRDSVVYPGVIIEGETVLGEGCTVFPGCRLTRVTAGHNVEFRDHSVAADSTVADDVAIGPFAHLRAGTVLDAKVRVGNFVEVKKSRLGRGTKASHLAYLGDAQIGADCNIGAGTITCNYDGERKNPTILGDGVFIGSDSQLVAPVTVGAGSYVAAGTTLIEDVPPGSLAIARAEQKNVEGWVEKRKAKRAGRAAR